MKVTLLLLNVSDPATGLDVKLTVGLVFPAILLSNITSSPLVGTVPDPQLVAVFQEPEVPPIQTLLNLMFVLFPPFVELAALTAVELFVM